MNEELGFFNLPIDVLQFKVLVFTSSVTISSNIDDSRSDFYIELVSRWLGLTKEALRRCDPGIL